MGCTDSDKTNLVRNLISSLIVSASLSERSNFEDTGDISVAEMTTKLDDAITAKQESEAKATSLATKVEQYELEISQLKEKVNLSAKDSFDF